MAPGNSLPRGLSVWFEVQEEDVARLDPKAPEETFGWLPTRSITHCVQECGIEKKGAVAFLPPFFLGE